MNKIGFLFPILFILMFTLITPRVFAGAMSPSTMVLMGGAILVVMMLFRPKKAATKAAQAVAEAGDITKAAIASRETAELYGLDIIRENVNEASDNTTRFVVVSRTLSKEKKDHSIIVFTVPDEAGALAHAINIIGHHGYSMRHIKSRAMKDLIWTYYFYVELKGDLQSSRRGKYMMEELSECCDKLKMIGTFNENSKI